MSCKWLAGGRHCLSGTYGIIQKIVSKPGIQGKTLTCPNCNSPEHSQSAKPLLYGHFAFSKVCFSFTPLMSSAHQTSRRRKAGFSCYGKNPGKSLPSILGYEIEAQNPKTVRGDPKVRVVGCP